MLYSQIRRFGKYSCKHSKSGYATWLNVLLIICIQRCYFFNLQIIYLTNPNCDVETYMQYSFVTDYVLIVNCEHPKTVKITLLTLLLASTRNTITNTFVPVSITIQNKNTICETGKIALFKHLYRLFVGRPTQQNNPQFRTGQARQYNDAK